MSNPDLSKLESIDPLGVKLALLESYKMVKAQLDLEEMILDMFPVGHGDDPSLYAYQQQRVAVLRHALNLARDHILK